ncbi:hypothetical protein ASD64_04580 [Mesorhizobium sp. Root157]|uniref:TadG family pilus assembly protein n=1 Tax=Mesorhizobium sp. Root157 TaxID=1736477 RepID=UPI0006F87616|nr:TadG family pilus assembly protein [Mesorhizobium sp. Root157]KQZ94154.1 hypothetical protein ASD64_04580 [Mesorhizobium sp. Root157]
MRHDMASAVRDLCQRFLSGRRANFAVMTALCAPVAITLTAFAVDEGALYTERREAQSLVDLAAITAAANIGKADAAVLATFADNGMSSVTLHSAGSTVQPSAGRAVAEVARGRYVADASVAAPGRFEVGKQPYNAVQVSMRKVGHLYFGGAIMAPPVIGTTAIASAKAEAAFSVGSRLLKLDGGIVNALLGGLVGGDIKLDIMDYNALIAADIDVLSFFDALAVQLHLTGGTYSDVLASEAAIGQIAAAMASVPGLDHTSKLALQTIAASATNTVKVPLSHLVDLGPVGNLALGQKPAGLTVAANALGMLTAGAALANGNHQVEVDLGVTVPGLASATLDLAIGEPEQFSPWLAVGEAGAVVRTAQTRIKLTATVSPGTSALGSGIKLLSVKLPLHVEVAHAEARLSDISCPTGRPDSVKVAVAANPGVASLRLAESDGNGFADFTRPQSFHEVTIAEASIKLFLLSLDLLKVKGQAFTAIENMAPQTLTFDRSDIDGRKPKTVSTHDFTKSLTTSLAANLSLSVNAGGLGLDVTGLLGAVKPAVVATLGTVAEPVDTLLNTVLGMLGVSLGQADIRVTGATCGRSVLVQ